jgi:hypothetical protein
MRPSAASFTASANGSHATHRATSVPPPRARRLRVGCVVQPAASGRRVYYSGRLNEPRASCRPTPHGYGACAFRYV